MMSLQYDISIKNELGQEFAVVGVDHCLLDDDYPNGVLVTAVFDVRTGLAYEPPAGTARPDSRSA
jgi:hypothetical protein